MIRLRVLVAGILMLGSVWAAQLSSPGAASACSCRVSGPEDIAQAAGQPRAVVFIGTVTKMDQVGDTEGHTFGQMQIERLFKGALPALVRVRGGGGGDCTMALTAGQHMVTVADWSDGVLTPQLCTPYGDPDTAEGQALVAAAVAAYGPGVAPAGQPLEEAPHDGEGDAGSGIIALVIASIAGFAILVLAARLLGGRRTSEERR